MDELEQVIDEAVFDGDEPSAEKVAKAVRAWMRKKMPKEKTGGHGRNCDCGAYGSCECGCGANWHDDDVYRSCLSDVRQAFGLEEK